MWKLANLTPIFKKGDKQLTKNYRPISLLPICGKGFVKIIFNKHDSYVNANNLITIYFEGPKSLEVVFLDISKSFDNVWHGELVFKLQHPQLIFNGTAVVKVNEQKHLGLILEPGLSFEKLLIKKIIKAKKNIEISKYLSKILPLQTLDQMYKALVRPHLPFSPFDFNYSFSSSVFLIDVCVFCVKLFYGSTRHDHYYYQYT